MANVAAPERSGWLMPALAIVAAITVARVGALALMPIDLFVDEAQYWLWGQDLAFGYYSKPPMIGWMIRAVTDLAGSDAAFWVRLPGPLLHGATALILGAIAARLFGARAGILTAAGYATLPMVALASILISTDSVMFPFLALALAGYLRLLTRPGGWLALGTGLALGLAFMSKYAAIYFLFCAALAAALVPAARPRWQDAVLVLVAFLVTISPNVVWNIQNGLTTVQHTMDNADWVRDPSARAGVNLRGLASFLSSQFAVVGPVVFGMLLWLAVTARRRGPSVRTLLLFALPIVGIVCIQATLSKAYANWAAAAYLAGTVAVLPMLSRGWLVASFTINGAISVALPLAAILADSFILGDRLVLARYMGRTEMSRAIMQAARDAGQTAIVARDRDILADLFHTGRDSGLRFFSIPFEGRAPHHYAMNFAVPDTLTGTVLYVSGTKEPPACAPQAPPRATISPDSGAYRGHEKTLFVVPGDCWNRP